MTVSSQTNRVQYVGDGSTTAFAVPYPFLEDSHLVVVKTNIATQVDTAQTITTHYTLSGAGTQSGTCTFVSAPSSSERVTIYRSTPITQLIDLKENDVFAASSAEDAVDKLTMILIDLHEIASRGVAIDIISTEAVPDPESRLGVSDVFPAKITGPPVSGAHPFTEQRPVSGGTTWEDLPSGRTGSMYAFNGCNDALTNKYVLVSQHLDAQDVTAYRFNPPTTCQT